MSVIKCYFKFLNGVIDCIVDVVFFWFVGNVVQVELVKDEV